MPKQKKYGKTVAAKKKAIMKKDTLYNKNINLIFFDRKIDT